MKLIIAFLIMLPGFVAGFVWSCLEVGYLAGKRSVEKLAE